LRISPREVDFEYRGFHLGNSSVRKRLEHVAGVFLFGYSTGLEQSQDDEIARTIARIDPETSGFAYEGAAMALALRDHLGFRGSRIRRFMAGAGERHTYMALVGAGWALARIPWLRRSPEPVLSDFDPLLRWLAIDGYGFHEGFFRTRHFVGERHLPGGLTATGRRVFDQGLGRSLWFSQCADEHRIAGVIHGFAMGRWDDLWTGVGLAAGYAGGLGRGALETLASAAQQRRSKLALGAAFAAKARQRAGNPAPQTELACSIFGGLSSAEASQITDSALESISSADYLAWHREIERQMASLVRRKAC
jgi:hypothetical protein